MRFHPVLLAVLIGAAALADAVPAAAQIYSWRDAGGNLVLSNVHRSDGSIAPSTSARAVTLSGTDDSRTTFFDNLIVDHARRSGIRKELIRAVVQVESAFNPYARSPKGALGLMQLMPATAQRFGVINPFNPADNVRAGVAYLRELLDRYDGDEQLALAAYNAGPGAVDSHGQRIPPYLETRSYVSKVSGLAGPKVRGPHPPRIFKVVQTIDGRQVIKYTDREPLRR